MRIGRSASDRSSPACSEFASTSEVPARKSPSSGKAPLTVQFTDRSTDPDTGQPLTQRELLRAAKHVGLKAGRITATWASLADKPFPAEIGRVPQLGCRHPLSLVRIAYGL